MTILIVFLVILILALWVRLDFVLGRKAKLKKLTKKEYPLRMSDIDIFTTGPELFTDLFTELREAKQHIHVLFYIISDDRISTEFLTILQQKAKEGLEVRLLADSLGSRKLKKNMIEGLEKDGVQFSYTHQVSWPYLFYSSQVRNHRKIAVVDGKIGYVGGYNVGKEYINQDEKLSPWRDYHLKLTKEGVYDLQKEFLSDWLLETGQDLMDNSAYYPPLEKGKYKHRIIPSKGAYLEDGFSTLIKEAKESIFIGTPYFVPSERLIEDLIAARNRGVSLRILVPFVPDHILVKEASFRYFRRLLEHGAEVYQFRNGFYHAKTMIIDERICDIGTANFDRRSLFLNYEINCYTYDHEFISHVKDIVETDVNKSYVLTLERLNRFNPWRTCKEWIARLVEPLL